MATLYVIETGPTVWDQQQRLESAAGAPLAPEAVEYLQAAAIELSTQAIKAVYAASGEAERQAATLLADALAIKTRSRKDLRELDFGMWQGLTVDDIRRRQPKVYKQWTDAPASVCPPGGESLDEAMTRLRTVTKEIVSKHKGESTLLVLRPVAMELLQSLLEHRDLRDFWQRVQAPPGWNQYEMNATVL